MSVAGKSQDMDRERKIVTLVDGMTTAAAVGVLLGLSRERVRQIYKRATGKGIPVRGITRPPIGPSGREARQVRRFWVRVRPDESGCWLWVGGRYQNGYGVYNGGRRGGGGGYAHRAAYEMVKGVIPAGLSIDHLCRVPACVNPDHLEAVTLRENIMRSPIQPAALNSRKTHCIHGHGFTDENTRRTVAANGQTHRSCRTCARAAEFRARVRRRARKVAA